jgi:hypothetical protein
MLLVSNGNVALGVPRISYDADDATIYPTTWDNTTAVIMVVPSAEPIITSTPSLATCTMIKIKLLLVNTGLPVGSQAVTMNINCDWRLFQLLYLTVIKFCFPN